MCYGYNTQKIESIIKTQLKEAGGDLNGFDRPKAPIITQENRKIEYYNWWLLPSFYSKEEYPVNILNARAETIFEKPSFRNVIQNKRCLVPASFYYEHQWRDTAGKSKVKYKIGLKDKDAFFMAGVYDNWEANGNHINTFSIVTCEANELCAEIHNSKKRMPVVLSIDAARTWLNPNLTEVQIKGLLKPFPTDLMFAEPVTPIVDLFT